MELSWTFHFQANYSLRLKPQDFSFNLAKINTRPTELFYETAE